MLNFNGDVLISGTVAKDYWPMPTHNHNILN